MARMRSVKPEFWDDLALTKVSRDARLLYISMWNFADEESRMHGDARWIKGHCLPYDDDLNLQAVEKLINELVTAKRVVVYSVDGATYMFLPKLAKHQRLEPGRVPSRLPAPPPERGDDPSTPTVTASEPIVTQHVAGGMEHVAGSMGQVAARGAARTADDLLNEHVSAYRNKVPSTVVTNTRSQIRALLAEGFDSDQVRDGLAVLRNKCLGPSALPSAVNEAINAPPRVPRPRANPAEARNDANADVIRRIAARQTQAIEGTR